MNNKNVFISMTIVAGLFFSPMLCQKALGQPPLPDSATLDSIVQGQVPGMPAKPEPPKPALKQIENALRQNMQSAEYLLKTARSVGASEKDLEEMEKMSIGFLKMFLTSITPAVSKPDQTQVAPQPKAPEQPKPVPVKPAPPKAPAPKPAPQAAPQAPLPPQGVIITAPDGSKWLVTPQAQPKPKAPRDIKKAPKPQGNGPAEVIILEEETVEDMPLWPTKEQLDGMGVLKYLEKRSQIQNQ